MHCETPWHQVRYTFGERESMEILSGEIYGPAEIFHRFQTLQAHPHIHCVVPGGGLSPDHTRSISSPSNFFLPVKVLSHVFRDKFVAGLRRAFRSHQLLFYGECVALAEEKNFIAFLDSLVQARLGSVCQAALWRTGTCVALSGPLHSSRGHL